MVPLEAIAHKIIYVGSVLVMLAALLLVIFGWDKLIRSRLAESGTKNAGAMQKLGALLHDPLRFGALWQMVYMNLTVSGVGIFMAVKLDEIFRAWPAREERISLSGHWHIFSGVIATILLLFYADLAGVRHVAHTLKSSAASVGGMRLSGICAEIESRIRQGDTGDLRPQVDALVTEVRALLDALEQLNGARS